MMIMRCLRANGILPVGHVIRAVTVLILLAVVSPVSMAQEAASDVTVEAIAKSATPSESSTGSAPVSTPAPTLAVAPAPTPVKVGSHVNYTAYIGQVILGLTVVLMLIFVLTWVLRKFGQGGLGGGSHMRVLASMPLGTRDRLALVDVAGQQLLLGISPGRITTLHTFTTPVINTDDNKELSEFGQKIREIIGRGTIRPE